MTSQLGWQDRHVTDREIETTLGIIAWTFVCQTKFVRVGSHTICQSFQKKKVRVDWLKEMLQKYDRGASKHVTGDKSWIYAYEPESKQQSIV